MQKLQIDKDDRCLILAPHPDDESIGCGGMLLKYNCQCDVVCITDGRQGQGNENPSELKAKRRTEFMDAMSYATVHDYEMLGIEDGTLCGHQSVLEGYDLSRYSKIFVTGLEDRHPDHSAALMALKRACIKQKIDKPSIFIYEVHRPLKDITHMLSIDDVVEKKKELMHRYPSQMNNHPFDEVIIRINKDRGNGKGYSEGFYQIRLSEIPNEIPIETELSKMREYYWIYTRWMKSLQRGNGIAGILISLGYSNVMIYGFKELGQLLLDELTNKGIHVPMIIDKQQINIDVTIPMVRPESIPDNMKDTPVVVTATWYMDEIKLKLMQLGVTKIISIKELLENYE